MTERINKSEFITQLAQRMGTKDEVAAEWLEGMVETLYENFKAGNSVTLPGFGSFYVRPERSTWVFKFSPAQKLRAMLGWPTNYKGKI